MHVYEKERRVIQSRYTLLHFRNAGAHSYALYLLPERRLSKTRRAAANKANSAYYIPCVAHDESGAKPRLPFLTIRCFISVQNYFFQTFRQFFGKDSKKKELWVSRTAEVFQSNCKNKATLISSVLYYTATTHQRRP